jgi:hypothetical protein
MVESVGWAPGPGHGKDVDIHYQLEALSYRGVPWVRVTMLHFTE